jgi:cell wall-associated NlpC family hydrolase
VDTLGFQSKWDAKSASFLIGDKDPNFVLKMNSREAQKAGEKIKLASAPIIINQSAHIPLSAIGDLFQQDMTYVVNDSHLVVQANQNDANISIKSLNDDHLDFADDPSDPNKPVDQASATSSNDQAVMKKVSNNDSIVALANINIPRLISKAKQYIGVRYEFGAAPYPQSGAFDCSSFTQYVFGQQGISLNRLARDQAKQGVTVGRQDLRVGDLLFFNIPGRFKSRAMPGHVGIYLGNQKIINADNLPKSGVQITDINKKFWKNAYLFAKRVAY